MVEIVDAPIIEMPPVKLSQVNRAGGLRGGESGNGNRENDSMQGTTTDSQNDIESNKIGWTQTNGPYGGTITALHATPEGTLFAGTEIGIFRSADSGKTWTPANEGLRVSPDNILPDILVLTQEGNTLYACTNGGLFYSTNGGDSWQQLTPFQDEFGISGVAIIDDTLYIGRISQESVFFSNDNGKSWEQIDSGLTDRDGPRLFAIGTTLFAQMRHHVFRLKAGEDSWTKLTLEDPWTKTTIESDITKFAVSGKTVYAATADGGLFRSTDTGNFWRSIKPKLMQHFNGELAVVGDTIFCVDSGSVNGQVFRSTDAGNSWTMYTTNLINQTILSVEALSEQTLYAGTFDGVFRSTDSGESWTKINTGIINTWIENLVFFRNALYTIITGDGIVKSVDGGNSWVPANNGLVASDGGILTVSGGKLYVATNETNYGMQNLSTSGVYRLADDGSSWAAIQRNMQSSNDRIYGVNELTVSGETFYIVGQMGDGARLYRWRMGEDLWTQLRPQDFLDWRPLAVLGRIVYISPAEGKLVRSFDEGDTWMDVSQNLPNSIKKMGIFDLAFVGDTLYVRPDDGVFRSKDGSKTWTSIDAGLPNGNIEIQLVDGTTLYGTNSHGIFRLTHRSDSWEKLASMQPIYVPSAYITSLAFDGTTFYAGTEAEGVYRFSMDE